MTAGPKSQAQIRERCERCQQRQRRRLHEASGLENPQGRNPAQGADEARRRYSARQELYMLKPCQLRNVALKKLR